MSSGVEKCHLVPVINKLLKLSPDEQKQIETIAKGKFIYHLSFIQLYKIKLFLGTLADQNSSWSSLFTWSQGT